MTFNPKSSAPYAHAGRLTTRPRRLLTVAHSYCVALNRRLAHEMMRAGGGRWEVVAAAPEFLRGDLRPVALEAFEGEASGLEGVPVYLSRRIHVMLYGRRLRELLRGGWDVVHCWEEPYVLAGAQVARWSPRGAAVVYATFQNIGKDYPPPFNWVERYSMNRASAWIAFGHTVERALAARPSYSARARRVIPPGVDVEKFRPDPDAGREALRRLGWSEGGAPVVGYLGRFVEQKGLRLLMRTLDRLDSDWRALLVGSGPLEGELRRWAGARRDRVRVVTGVKHDEVPPHLNAMDVLCAPSQTTPAWREQLGRMLIEAFACGVPVVASDSGEIPFVVGDAGEVVDEGDEDGWARAVGGLLESPGRRAELKARGLERARAVFAWPVVARRHLDFFEEVLMSRREMVA